MLKETIRDLGNSYGLELGKDNALYGQIGGQAVMVLPLTPESGCLMVKIRLSVAVSGKQDLTDYFEPDGNGNLELTLEKEYAWLTINDIFELDGSSKLNLTIERAIDALRQRDLLKDNTCHICGETSRTKLIYNGLRGVARACNTCNTERLNEHELETKRARRKRPAKWLLVFLMAIVGAAGWVLVWHGYDYVFKLHGRDTVTVPYVYMGIFALVAAAVVAGPLAWQLHSSLFGRMIAIAMLLFALVTGELSLWTLVIYLEHDAFVPVWVVQNILGILHSSPGPYLALKATVVLFCIIIVWIASKDRHIRGPLLNLKAKEE